MIYTCLEYRLQVKFKFLGIWAKRLEYMPDLYLDEMFCDS